MDTEIMAWIARNKDGSLYLHLKYEPRKYYNRYWDSDNKTSDFDPKWDSLEWHIFEIDSKQFPEVKWEDEKPTMVKLLIELDENNPD